MRSPILKLCGLQSRYWQPTARVPHLARQAISNGTQKLHALHIDLAMIHTEGILTLACIKTRMFFAH